MMTAVVLAAGMTGAHLKTGERVYAGHRNSEEPPSSLWERIPAEEQLIMNGKRNVAAGNENGSVISEKETFTTDFEDDVIRIRTKEDYLLLARLCRSDAWSEQKMIVLEEDLYLGDEYSVPIVSFGGTFDGQGHTIGGFSVTGAQAYTGLFGTIRESGTVRNLNVNGIIDPAGLQTRLGGIAGTNAGIIENCVFRGNVSAHAESGGIAGRNLSSGSIKNCISYGSIQGDSYSGGIAGYNEGVLLSCRNEAEVNTVYSDVPYTTDKLKGTIENILLTGSVNTPENLDARIDTGGIAGISSGLVAFCTNAGNIGYEHVGYNTGGIIGRNSGYVHDCTNEAEILGRKDVGGIVGQLQPFMEIDFSESMLGELEKELSKLQDDLHTAMDDASDYSRDTNTRLNELTQYAGAARNNIEILTDEAADMANRTAEQANTAASVLKRSFSDLSQLLSESEKFVRNLSEKTKTMDETIRKYLDEAAMPEDKKEALEESYRRFKEGVDLLIGGNAELSELLADGPEVSSGHSEEIRSAYQAVYEGYRKMKDASEDIRKILEKSDAGTAELNEDPFYRTAGSIEEAAAAMLSAMDEEESVLSAIRKRNESGDEEAGEAAVGELTKVTDLVDIAQAGFRQLVYGNPEGDENGEGDAAAGGSLREKMAQFTASAEEAGRPLSEEEKDALSDDVADIENACAEIDNASAQIRLIRNETMSDPIQLSEWEEKLILSIAEIRGSWETAAEAARDIRGILEEHAESLQPADDIVKSMEELFLAAGDLPDSDGQLSSVLQSLSGLDIHLSGVSETSRNAGKGLYEAMDGMLNGVSGLNSSLNVETEGAINDIRTITDQFGRVIDILEEMAEEQMYPDTDPGSHISDISEEDIEGTTQGRCGSCLNEGTVDADSHVGGIVGTIGVEYDLDPEQDIQQIGSTSMDYIFRAKGIVDKSDNSGSVICRNSFCGGIVGNMEMGIVSLCTDSGEIISDGDYTGGIAGYSQAGIQDCSAAADIAGVRYVGGIAGYGTKICRSDAMVNINEAEEFCGAVAGWVKDVDASKVHDNYFYSDTAYGINGTGYRGIAEEADYAFLCSRGRGNLFEALTLVFRADGEDIRTIQCQYGESVPAGVIPPVPKKEGFIGRWSREDFGRIVRSETITAVYERINTLLSSDRQRNDSQPVLLAEGAYTAEDRLCLISEMTQADEAERWSFVIPVGCRVRFLPPRELDDPVIFLIKDNTKIQLKTEQNGKYLAFQVPGGNVTFAVSEKETGGSIERLKIFGMATAAAVLLLLIHRFIRRKY